MIRKGGVQTKTTKKQVILENAALSASAGSFCWGRAARLFAGAVAAGAEARAQVRVGFKVTLRTPFRVPLRDL